MLTSKPELISGFHKKLKPACHSSFEFVQRELIRQLTETEPSEGELKLLADMIFLLLTSLNSEEKIKTLNDLVKVS